MQIFKFITCDDMKKPKGERKFTCWCTTNDLKTFRDFIQYVLDSCNKPEEYMLLDVENNKIYDMCSVAIGNYKMRKRTFEERMNGTQTGKWAEIEL